MTGSGLKDISVQRKVMLKGTMNKNLWGKAYYPHEECVKSELAGEIQILK